MTFALKETLASKRLGRDIWYCYWTQIGPCTTDDPKERALLKSREEWLPSKALRQLLSFFEIVELPEGSEGKWDWDKPAGGTDD